MTIWTKRKNKQLYSGAGDSRVTFPGVTGPQSVPQTGLWQEPPAEGDLFAIWYLTKQLWQGVKESQLLGACLLQWVLDDCIRIEKRMITSKLGLTSREEVVIVFIKSPEGQYYGRLYQYLHEASRDGILEKKELANWARANYQAMQDCLNSFCKKGEMVLFQMGAIEEVTVQRTIFKINVHRDFMTGTGLKMAAQTVGYRSYLKSLTMLREGKADEVTLWQERLVFATLFGIADQVAAEIQKLYPDTFRRMFPHQNEYWGNNPWLFYIDDLSREAEKGMASGLSDASSGYGGGSSIGGGGGSSGGGSGGGSR
jgi:uncharacterized membrane protein YgcG